MSLSEDFQEFNRIRIVLVEKRRSQVWLAKELGKGKSTVNKWCSNITQPPVKVLFEIAKLLDCSARDLLIDDRKDKNR